MFLTLLFMTTLFFFFNDTATTEIYTLSLHDALPILPELVEEHPDTYANMGIHDLGDTMFAWLKENNPGSRLNAAYSGLRSEEHTSEPQSPCNLVCRLLLEKKNSGLHKQPSACRSRLP